MRKEFLIFLFLILVLVFASCSHGINPTSPLMSDPNENQDVSICSPENVIADREILNPTRGVLGIWKVQIDTTNLTAEIIPARNAQAIGNIFDADLSQFLTVSPCENCISIPGVYFDGYENLNVIVRMKHPFGNLATRPDLHGFDVRAIFIHSSSITDSNIKVMRPSGVEENASYSNWMLNPDGFTSHFDELASDARYFLGGSDVVGNLNPFLRFFEDYATPTFDPHAPDGHNVMPVGSGQNNRTAVFGNIPIGTLLNFYIVADVSYGQSAVLANRTNPQYYLPAFHRTEAWRAEYWIENNNIDSWDNTSTADVVVQVFDWQHGSIVDPSYPNPSYLSGIPEQSDVLRLELSIPEIQDAPIITTNPEIGYGTPTNPLRYRMTITNENRAYYNPTGLLAIRDDLYGQASPHGRMPIPESPSGFPYETTDILDYALYIPITVNIRNGMFGPDLYDHNSFDWNTLIVPDKDQFAPDMGSTCQTTIHPWYFRDPSHRKFQYRWDYDYDGVTFNEDGGGTPSPTIDFATAGRKNVGLRIRDNAVPTNELIYQIPVYAEGEAYHQNVPSTELNRDIASSRRRQAIDVNADNVFFVYSHEEGGTRDIWLAIANRAGNITTHRITDVSDVCYNPALEVISLGTSAGIYIVYSRKIGAEAFLYSTHGNLDGSGFSPSNTKRITNATEAIEEEPCIIRDYLRFNVFWTNYDLALNQRIYGAYSTDDCDTWNSYGWVADNGSTKQYCPAATVTSYQHSILVWEDFVNAPANAADLFMTKVRLGSIFEDPVNISIFHDGTWEYRPSVSYGFAQIAIAYLCGGGPDLPRARLKILNASDNSQIDFPIDFGTGTDIWHTQPCISGFRDNNFIYSFGSYNHVTDVLTCNVLHLYRGLSMNNLDYTVLLEQNVGTITTSYDGNETYPGIVSYTPISSASENFIIFRNYISGSYTSTSQPREVCGQISLMYYVCGYEE